MRVLVTGREGQVVRSLIERSALSEDRTVIALGRPEFDLENPGSLLPLMTAAQPDIVVSAAAYTAVDRAEEESSKAWAINAFGAGAVAAAAAKINVPVIHLSTDYVFSGEGHQAYLETDMPAPQSVYGRSKLAGEEAVRLAQPRSVILRTAWVYSPFGKNFLKTMLGLAETRDQISVVGDQWGNPTSALDIADAIFHIAPLLGDMRSSLYGTYNLSGTGATNWSGFARHILHQSRKLGGPHAEIVDISTAEYPTPAKRPANSQLSNEKMHTVFGWRSPNWQDASQIVVERMLDRHAPSAGAC